MVGRIIRIVVSPEAEWQRVRAEQSAPALAYAAVLSLVPAAAALVMRARSEIELPAHLAAFVYLSSLGCVLAVAGAFRALGALAADRARWAGCVKLAVYGATPVWLSAVVLVTPVLVIVCAVALLHTFYLYHVGAQQLLGVPRTDAAQFVAIALAIASAAATLGGAAAAALALL